MRIARTDLVRSAGSSNSQKKCNQRLARAVECIFVTLTDDTEEFLVLHEELQSESREFHIFLWMEDLESDTVDRLIETLEGPKE